MGDMDNIVDKKIIDDHLKRLFDQYKASTKVFSATHIGHISVSVVFLISILLPFLYLQIETRDNDLEILQLSKRVEQQEGRIAAAQQTMSGLRKFFEGVENAPKPLASYILSLETEADGGPRAVSPDEDRQTLPDSCGPPDDKDTWMACRIERFMNDRFIQNRQILSEEVAAPLEKLGIKEFDEWQADFEIAIRVILERARKEMAADPTFWMDFNQASPIYRSIIEGAQQFLISHDFEGIRNRMAQEAESLQMDVDRLNQKKADIQKRKNELNNSLKGFKTRFGKIGMELSQAILIAPIVFSLLFVLIISNLMGSIRLRKSFHTMLVQFKDPLKTAITDSEVALTMPLWIDPMDPPLKRKLRGLILMIPVIVAVLTLIVILYCLKIPGAFPGWSVVDGWKYLIYYLLSAGFFIYGSRKIKGAVKDYSTPSVRVENIPDIH